MKSSRSPRSPDEAFGIGLGPQFVIALRALRRHTLRSSLTALGIFIGVAAVITVVGVGAGTQQRVLERVESLGANLLYLAPGTSEIGGVRLDDRQPAVTLGDVETIRREVPSLTAVAASAGTSARVIWRDQNYFSRIQGTTPDYFLAREWPTAEGRLFTPAEVKSAAKVAVLGATVAQALFESRSPLGETVRIGSTPFRVVGVLQEKGQAPQGTDQDDKVVVPLSTAQLRVVGRSVVRPGAVEYVHIRVGEAGQMNAAIAHIRDILRARHQLPEGQPDDFLLNDLAELQESVAAASRSLQFWLATVAGVSLLVGGISIMNVMLFAVTERTPEIGLRRATGARRVDVGAQFLIESVALSVVGGTGGLAFGVVLVLLLARVRDFPVVISPSTLLLAVGFAAAVGVCSGFYPALLASRLDPIVALRSGG